MADIPAFLTSVFPATKLRLPGSQDTVHRGSLIEQLRQQVLSHRLTLISAPAGSGKTTLAADFARSSDTVTVRWLSLDDEDNNLQSFLLAIVLAVLPDADGGWIHMISQGMMPPRQIANALINRLDESSDQPFVLVLDDLHLLTDIEIHQFIDYLVERIPAHVHLLVTTRYDPPLALPKLRARGELAELRLDSLRFNRAEVSELLNRVLRLNIPDTLVKQMVERTEGWIAGLRLLALSLEGIDAIKRAQYIEDLAQKDRYVFDLLAEEVLTQQRPDIRRFLLETSILDELTPEGCAAITQQPDAADKLRELHRHNLFLVSVGDGSYRYHALFRDFLREQLKRYEPDTLKELHRHAAHMQTDRSLKLDHLVTAEQWNEVSDTIRQAMLEGIARFFSNTLGLRWTRVIERIPAALQQTDPWLMAARGSLAFDRGDYGTSTPLMESAYRLFHQHCDAAGEFLTKVYMLLPQVEQTGRADLFREFYDLFSSSSFNLPMTPQLHTSLLQTGLWNSAVSYRHDEVESFLLQLVDELIRNHDQEVFPTFAQSIGHAVLFTRQGATPFDRVLPIMKRYAGGDKSIVRMGINNIEAFLALFRGDIDAAWAAVQNAREIIRYYDGFAWADAVVDHTIMAVLLIRSDYAAFDRYFQERAPQIVSVDTSKQIFPEFLYLYGKRLLAEGQKNRQWEAVQAVIEQIEANIILKEHEALLLALRGHLARHQGDLNESLRWMRQAAELQPPFQRFYPSHTALGLALVYWQRGDGEQAFRTLEDSLQPLVEWGFPGIVLLEGRDMVPLLQAAANRGIFPEMCRFCLSILNPDHNTHAIDIPGSTESLTPREVDILRLAVNGASNREIADTLVISENTVKSHLTRILGKLGAKSRTEAAARVRDLGIPL